MIVSEKDTSEIPEGQYCYVPDVEKNNNKSIDDHKYYIKLCPYFKIIEDEGVKVVHCQFLELGGLINGTSEEDFDKLVNKYGSDDNVWDKYPLDLLWDQVKECGENCDYKCEK